MKTRPGAVILLLALLLCAVSPALAQSLPDTVERVKPAVVTVLTVTQSYSRGKPNYAKSQGSGVIISEDGLVLTAAHVVQISEAVAVRMSDGTSIPADVVGTAPHADVALLQLSELPQGMAVAKLGDSSKTRIGEEVFVLGAPYGMEHTLTVGHVSALHKSELFSTQFAPLETIQTDAAINQGNSGGPLFNLAGEVIGIVSYILSQSGGFEGLGFAVSSNTAKALLLDAHTIWLGVDFLLIKDEMAKALNIGQEVGLLVQRVSGNSLASRLGLKGGIIPVKIGDQKLFLGGDVVLEIMGIAVSEDLEQMLEVRDIIAHLDAGDDITMKVMRNGKIENLVAHR